MMNNISFKKKTVYMAVAATLGMLAVGNANAVLTFGSELPAGSDLAGGTWTPAITSFAPSAANPLYLTFTLTNGASFNTLTSASLACNAGGVTATTAAMVTLAAGGAGTGAATFVVTASSAGAQLSSCTITNGTAHIGSTISVSETVSAVYGNALAPSTTNSTALIGAATMFTNATTASTNTALVQTGFISFSTANAVAGSTFTTARVGGFTLSTNGNLLATGMAANQTAMTAIVTAITISLGGNAIAAANATTGGMYITYNSAVATPNCGSAILVSALGGVTNITFSAVSPSPAGGATSAYTYAVCMGVSGAVIPEGTITVGVNGTPNTDPVNANGSAFQISTLIAAGTTVGTITHNGASTTVLNVPRSTDPDVGFVRVYNTTNLAGPVTVTVYSQGAAGQTVFTPLVSNCTLTSSLAGNGALVMSVAQIVAACGFTEPTSGRYRMDLAGAFPTMRAQAFARASGVLTNISSDTSGNGN